MTVEIVIGIGIGAIIGQVLYQFVLKMAQIVLAKRLEKELGGR